MAQERQNEQQAHPRRSDFAVVEQGGPFTSAQDPSTSRDALQPGRGTAASSMLTGTDPGPQNQRREAASPGIVPHGTIFASGEGQPPAVNTQTQYDCSICLDSSRWKTMKSLPCRHQFHKVCIDKWLNENGRCPLCRQMPTPARNVPAVTRNHRVIRLNMPVPTRIQRVAPRQRLNRNAAGTPTDPLFLWTLTVVSLVAAFISAITTIFITRAS